VGTLGVNLVGSFLIGFFSGAINRFVFASPWPEFLLIGFLGSYTTFSTFSLESLNLMRDSEFFWLAANLVLQVAGGILFALVGLWLFARLLDS
jgi:CrcB protein